MKRIKVNVTINETMDSILPSGLRTDRRLGDEFQATFLPGIAKRKLIQTWWKTTRKDGQPPNYVRGPLLIASARPDRLLPCSGDPIILYRAVEYDSLVTSKTTDALHLREILENVPCFKYGIRTRVEYLRTTLGRKKDYQFDPKVSYDSMADSV